MPDVPSPADHWNAAYGARAPEAVSWFEDVPSLSLDLIAQADIDPAAPIIDVGGGASCLVDHLLAAGHADITVLDLSATALEAARARLGPAATGRVTWIAADVTRWTPDRPYGLWHDRAAFHFLTDPADRAAYVARLSAALSPGGWAVIATFAADGPERCSGLPVRRYDPAALAHELGPGFRPVAARHHAHVTPAGAVQRFQASLLRRVADVSPRA